MPESSKLKAHGSWQKEKIDGKLKKALRSKASGLFCI
jgi:hypothetical protein